MVEQPHFVDEVTTLTARPVVPLEEIDAKLKHRRHWFLGGAFALAMLLGAASALISAYFKFRNIPDPEIQSVFVSQPVIETSLPTIEIVPERPKPKPKNTDHMDRPVVQSPIQPRLNEEDELERIRDSVLIDEWQERRQRRVERRERREWRERRRAQRSGRDLSNLDEIFEGSRRPRS